VALEVAFYGFLLMIQLDFMVALSMLQDIRVKIQQMELLALEVVQVVVFK
jgi:hypothetical protein